MPTDRATPSDLSVDDLRAALAHPAFAGLPADAPLLVTGGDPPRLLHVNDAAQALFRAPSLADVARRLDGAEPGARRLAQLAADLAPGAPPRLERLRFFIDGMATPLTFLCRRIQGDRPLFIAAALDVRRSLLVAPPPARGAAEPAVPEAAPAAPAPARARAGDVRFVWRTDAEHRFTALSAPFTEAMGGEAGDLIGAGFLDLAAAAGFDPEGRLRAALEGRATWSGVEVFWPTADGRQAAPVTLGAAPAFDRARRFAGYSGFGVIHLDRARPVAPAETAAPAAPAQEPPAPEAAAPVEAPHDAPAPPPAETPAAAQASETAEPVQPVEPVQPSLFGPAPAAARGVFLAPNVVALDAWKATPAPRAPEPPAEESVQADATDEAGDVAAPPAGPLADEIAEATAAEAEAPGDLPADDAGPDEDEDLIELTRSERSAFREIARALGARLDRTPPTETPPEPPQRPAPERSRPAPPPAAAPAGPRAAMELLDRIDLGLLVCRDGAPIYVNKALTALLGYPDAAAFEAENGLARMFRGRAPEAADELDADGFAPVLTRTGETVALSARLQAIDWDGAPATLISLRRTQEPELAQRVRALEGDLLQRDARARELHAILDTATDGVVTLDDEGRLLSLNRSAEALFGYEQNEVAGEPFTILFARDSHAAALDYLAGLQSNGVRSVLNDGREVTGRARQGGQIPMFMTLGRIGDKPTGKFCAVLRDLTQWKNAERELKEARREAERTSALKSDFLARISHEVRTPLNAILGFAEVMRDERFGPLGNERYKDYLKDIHASGAHVLSLVNDLLDLSKIEAGKMDLSFESVDANGVVSECVSIMQSQAIRERVILRLSLAPRLPNIVADERALRQIVLNILSNAVKFNQPGGQVIVSSALTDAGAAVIRVRDTGIGMNEREIETALEPFRQVETARPTTGTGLGLPLTKALVEANRATFTIRSRKGEGTLVEVSFPSTRVLAE